MSHDDHANMDHSTHVDHSKMDHGHMDHNHGAGGQEPLAETTFSPAAALFNAITTTVIPAVLGQNGGGGHHDHHNHGEQNNGLQSGSSSVAPHVHGSGHDMPGMKMWFHFGYDEPWVLFKFWTVSTIGGLIGSMIGIFLMAMLYEGLKVLREYLLQRTLQNDATGRQSVGSSASSSGLRVPLAGEGDSVLESQTVVIKTLFRPNPLSLSHGIQTVLHMLQLTLSYLLMLIFMTFNVWLCLAVVLGAGAGYFAFGWRKRTIIDINEHCH